MLHELRPDLGEEARYLSTGVTPGRLTRLLEERSDWEMLHPRDLGSSTRSRRTSPSMLLTFDDGYRDVIVHALPILERFEAPALIFVTTGFVDREATPFEQELAFQIHASDSIRLAADRILPLNTAEERLNVYHRVRLEMKGRGYTERREMLDELSALNGWSPYVPPPNEYLDWAEVRTLAGHDLITIGGHTKTHPLLTGRPPEEVEGEVLASKARLEAQLSIRVRHFSYPYGGHSSRIRSVVRGAGYEFAFGTRSPRLAMRTSRYAIPRVDIAAMSDGSAP